MAITNFVVLGARLVCPPVEEGNATCFRKGYDEHKVIWQKDNIKVSECTLDYCSDSNKKLTLTTISLNNNTGEYVSTLRLLKVDLFNGLWQLQYPSSKIANCTLNVFVKPVSAHCDKAVTPEGIVVNCTIHKVYPEIKCNFEVEVDEYN